MWSSEEAAPAPPATAPPPCKYRSVRQSELEQLRQRGLAKLLNKHFTSVTQAIAEERAAADAALRDLEERKAAGLKEWGDAGGPSVWDSLYMDLQRKKAECKRKEKETLLLYQRYVAKFGSTGVVAAPTAPVLTSTGQQPPLFEKGDEYQDESISSIRVPFLASQIEDSLNKHESAGGERHPSIQSLGVNGTYQKAFASMDEQERLQYLRALEGRSVDAQISSPLSPSTTDRKKRSNSAARVGLPDTTPDSAKRTASITALFNNWESDETPGAKSQLTATTTSSFEDTNEGGEEGHNGPGSPESELGEEGVEHKDEEAKSILSELTSVNSLVISDAEIRLVEFLKTETEAIRKMLDEEEEHSVRSYYSSEVGSHSALAANQAEDMVLQMQQILQDYQDQMSSSSLASIDTPRREPRPFDTGNPNEQWMIYFDETYQREYFYEVKSHRTQWTPPDEVAVADYTSTARSGAPLSHLDVMPEFPDAELRPSRREEYRRLRRRRRKRRLIIMFALVSSCALVGGLYVHKNHPELLEKVLRSSRGSETVTKAEAERIQKELEMQKKKEAKERELEKKRAAAAAKEEERRRKLEEERRKQEEERMKLEKERREREEERRKQEEERRKREEIELMAKEVIRMQEEARLAAERAEADRVEEEQARKRDKRAHMVKSVFEIMLQAPRPL